LLSRSSFADHAFGYTNGTTVLHLNPISISEYSIKIPPKLLVKEFTKLVTPIYTHIDLNKSQSRSLAALRDTLLPRLMRGEVRVSEL
jgi:type I restriction enzyme S subunit